MTDTEADPIREGECKPVSLGCCHFSDKCETHYLMQYIYSNLYSLRTFISEGWENLLSFLLLCLSHDDYLFLLGH